MQQKFTNPDPAVMDGFQRGHESAFDSVYRALFPSLYLYAHKITADQLAAEDLVEDAFLKIWERRSMFTQFNVLKSYLFTTVRNASLSWVRSNIRKETAEQKSAQENVIPEKTVLENLIEAETRQFIYDEMDKLPPRSRQIMYMYYIEGKRTRNIARELQISVNTVKSHKFQSLGLLKKNMRPS